MPAVSVILPAYNAGHFVEKAIAATHLMLGLAAARTILDGLDGQATDRTKASGIWRRNLNYS